MTRFDSILDDFEGDSLDVADGLFLPFHALHGLRCCKVLCIDLGMNQLPIWQTIYRGPQSMNGLRLGVEEFNVLSIFIDTLQVRSASSSGTFQKDQVSPVALLARHHRVAPHHHAAIDPANNAPKIMQPFQHVCMYLTYKYGLLRERNHIKAKVHIGALNCVILFCLWNQLTACPSITV